jgi:hypothetical protein
MASPSQPSGLFFAAEDEGGGWRSISETKSSGSTTTMWSPGRRTVLSDPEISCYRPDGLNDWSAA